MEEKFFHSLSSVPLSEVIREEYRNYQIYTLMDRAIPYLQDGLKPCQRRILFTLWKSLSKGLMKVSSATGLVLTLHPHGPASIESSIVNLAQDFTFSNNYPLIDKKGYFGERMETEPAASRYIECKLGKMAQLLLFDDMNQVEMIPNYDEKVMEPVALFPKLPLMLLNGAEGIGTGFSSMIPSFHHKEIIDSMINVVQKGKAKKLKPFVRNFSGDLSFDENGKIQTKMRFEQIGDSIYITELPRGMDSQRIYKHLGKFIEKDFLKDYIDSSVENIIKIELIFKRGSTPTLKEVENEIASNASIVPNYTLISERGIKIFDQAEEIIQIFTEGRLKVVHQRYVLLAEECQKRLNQNNEIIRFIQEKHFAIAQKCENRKEFVDYLRKKDFVFSDYLADMPIYRMTKEEVTKRTLAIKEDTTKLKAYRQVIKSPELVKEKLIEELQQTREDLSALVEEKEEQKRRIAKDMSKGAGKKKKK